MTAPYVRLVYGYRSTTSGALVVTDSGNAYGDIIYLDGATPTGNAADTTARPYAVINENGWRTSTWNGETEFVDETIQIQVYKTDGAGLYVLASFTKMLSKMLAHARQAYNDPGAQRFVWLEVQGRSVANNEIDYRERSAVVVGGSFEFDIADSRVQGLNSRLANVTLKLKRLPAWERTYNSTTVDGKKAETGKTSLGYAVDVTSIQTNATYTDYPSRLISLSLKNNTNGFYQGWVGFKGFQYSRLGDGAPASYNPNWYIGSGSVGYVADSTFTVSAPDTNQAASQILTCTFATNTALVTRASIAASQMSITNYDAMMGEYVILLRAKMSGGTAYARFGVGFSGAANLTYTPRIPITGTAWKFYEAGRVSFTQATNYYLYLQAQSVSAGTFYADQIVLMPTDYLVRLTAPANITGTDYPLFGRLPNRVFRALHLNASAVTLNNIPASEIGAGIPVYYPKMVIVAQSSTGSVKTDTLDYSIISVMRHLAMVGFISY